MEHLSEFVKNLRERLASPFFFSFIVSWILFNWKITVALLWYNPTLYPNEGDLIRFVESNTSNWQSIWFPLIGAFVYTGLFRNLISALVEFTMKWGGDLNLKISKGSKVSMEKFLTYRDMYLQTNKELENIIRDEKKTIEEAERQRQKNAQLEGQNVSLQGEILKVKSDNDELKKELTSFRHDAAHFKKEYETLNRYFLDNEVLLATYKDRKSINGTWKFRYDNKFRDVHYEETYYIMDGIVYTRSDSGTTESSFEIAYYFNDVINKKLLLILKFIPETIAGRYISEIQSEVETFRADNDVKMRTYFRTRYSPVLIHDLDVRDEKKFVGTENVEAIISYEKLS